MKYQAVILGLLMGFAVSPVRAAASDVPSVGVRTLSVFSEARGEPLSVTIWYPAGPGGEADLIGDDRIFAGTPALRDAPARADGYPLVLLSHGSGATVEKMSWIATDLAARGYVVAGPNHPGTTSGDSTPEDTPKLWERTDDLSEINSYLLKAPEWKEVVDADRVAALGFSLGGAAVLELAGARGDLDVVSDQVVPLRA
ncbi:hypothetical protein FMN50_19500 [Rhodobacterales bacterium]|nr:hypothetical protein FMN50_19500 [Rhodobacterales bacterium]